MVHVTPVHADRLLFSSTFVARPGPLSQEREFYLSFETGLLLDTVLTQFADGDREIVRSFFPSLYAAFKKEFPKGQLVSVLDYVKNRVIYFEQKEGQLSRLVVCRMQPQKELGFHGDYSTAT
jgi:hypothetical protein